MPRIVEIAGTKPTGAALLNEANDRAKLVQPLGFVDTVNLSEGEMTLYLKAQQDLMLAQFYQGTPAGALYKQAFEQKRDILYKGLHTIGVSYANLRLQSQPASGWSDWSGKQRTPARGIKQLFGDAPRIGDAIPQIDCNAAFPILTQQQFTATGAPASVYQSYVFDQQKKRDNCVRENLWREGLNQWWPSSGVVLIYNDFTPSMTPNWLNNAAVFNLGQKVGRHQLFVDTINTASKISKNNLSLWLVNGCMEKSIQGANGQSLGPLAPIDWIDTYKEAGKAKIGFPFQLIPIAVKASQIGFQGFLNFIQFIKGKQSLKDVIQTQGKSIEEFFNQFGGELENLASPKDFENADTTNSDGDNPPPPPPDGSGGGNFFDNLSTVEKVGLGLAVVGVGYALTNK